MKNQVVQLDDHRSLIELVRNRVGDKFVISFIEEGPDRDQDKCHVYLSEDLNDMEICYIADLVNNCR